MTQKEKAIECMEKLNIYKPYIKKFEDDGTVTLFEGFGGRDLSLSEVESLTDRNADNFLRTRH